LERMEAEHNGLTCRKVGEELLVLDRAAGRVCFLNRTAVEVWRLTSQTDDEQMMVEGLRAQYSGTGDADLRAHVADCRRDLARFGLLGRYPLG